MAQFEAVYFGRVYAVHWNTVCVQSKMNLTKTAAKRALIEAQVLHYDVMHIDKQAYPIYKHGEVVSHGAKITFTYPGEANLDDEILAAVRDLESKIKTALRNQELLCMVEEDYGEG